MKNSELLTSSRFKDDVKKGLTAFPKYLSAKYFYDEKGDKLFQKIMDMPEYYLTDCEFEILEAHKEAIANYFSGEEGFDLIELGAGDGKKTKILLRHLIGAKFRFDYIPIDISQHILDDLETSLKEEMPALDVIPMQGTYFRVLDKLAGYDKRKKVIMVLGSNIGNLKHKKAIEFLQKIRNFMNPEDMLFMGFDQKKDPAVILEAYNDKAGITAAFNKNILVRINSELGGDFDPESFLHWETYNPQTGTCKSFLVSQEEQEVYIQNLELTIHF